jgi:peptidoglycan/LPS O-acetylase OafA/YrhL
MSSSRASDYPHRIPSLDGLRAISIALVFAHHVAGTPHSPAPTSFANRMAFGELGVRVFFVISGFLITGLLLKELDRHQHIRLGRFYFRRTLRIFPPYYAFVVALIVLQAFGLIELVKGDVLHALTYTSNYHDRSWNTGHTWSLAVEEQFYLLWPAVLLLLGRRRGLIAAASVILVCPLIRLTESILPAMQDGIGHRFETTADALAVGCLLAGMRPWLKQQPLYQRLLRSKLFLLIPLLVVVTNIMHDRWRPSLLAGFTVMNIGIALTVDWCVTNHQTRVGRLLNSGPIVYVGTISYSLYLWQQIFLNRYSAAATASFPLNIGLAFLCALGSFYLIERPSLVLRQRVEKKWFGSDQGKTTSAVPIAQPETPRGPVSVPLIVAEDEGTRAMAASARAADGSAP